MRKFKVGDKVKSYLNELVTYTVVNVKKMRIDVASNDDPSMIFKDQQTRLFKYLT